jgi:hypothetical protein
VTGETAIRNVVPAESLTHRRERSGVISNLIPFFWIIEKHQA